jgi:hypothetical protein
LAEYVSAAEKVTIICPDHGRFEQTAHHHAQGKGCPDCARTGFNPNQPGLLYYLAIGTDEGHTRYKVGITNRTVEERYKVEDLARIRVVKIWRFALGRDAADRESEILYQFSGDRYYGPSLLVSAGNSEIFTHDVLGLDAKDDSRGQSAVDADANLIARQRQCSFDF